MKHEKSCGAVCLRGEGPDRQVLLVRHLAGGRWAFPKGHIEPGETEPQTALREVWEETGIRVVLLPGFRFATSYSPVKGALKQVVYFAARYSSGTPTPQPGEIRDARFFAIEDALHRLPYPTDKRLLRRVLHFFDTGQPDLPDPDPEAPLPRQHGAAPHGGPPHGTAPRRCAAPREGTPRSGAPHGGAPHSGAPRSGAPRPGKADGPRRPDTAPGAAAPHQSAAPRPGKAGTAPRPETPHGASRPGKADAPRRPDDAPAQPRAAKVGATRRPEAPRQPGRRSFAPWQKKKWR